jgi:hypothetical protein
LNALWISTDGMFAFSQGSSKSALSTSSSDRRGIARMTFFARTLMSAPPAFASVRRSTVVVGLKISV